MIIRKAEKCDEEAIYILSNDPEVRRLSYNQNPIEYTEHRDWFDREIRDPSVLFFVAYEKNDLVGQIRFTLNSHEAVVSVSVSSKFRGRGLGKEIMKTTLGIIFNEKKLNMIKAYIKKDNISSIKYFEACGFTLAEEIIMKGQDSYLYKLKMEME